MRDVLFEMKQDSEALGEVLTKIGSAYSDDLANFIRKCLTRNFTHRPTTKELCKLPFAQEALTLIGSSLGSKMKATKNGTLVINFQFIIFEFLLLKSESSSFKIF